MSVSSIREKVAILLAPLSDSLFGSAGYVRDFLRKSGLWASPGMPPLDAQTHNHSKLVLNLTAK